MSDINKYDADDRPLKVVAARYPLRLLAAFFALFILLAIVQSIATNPRWDPRRSW
jgi:polar amino acid transport system permease protein